MGVGLVGAMVEALRRHNRSALRPLAQNAPKAKSEPEIAAWELLTHPALLPTVYSPGCEDCPDETEEVAERKV